MDRAERKRARSERQLNRFEELVFAGGHCVRERRPDPETHLLDFRASSNTLEPLELSTPQISPTLAMASPTLNGRWLHVELDLCIRPGLFEPTLGDELRSLLVGPLALSAIGRALSRLELGRR